MTPMGGEITKFPRTRGSTLRPASWSFSVGDLPFAGAGYQIKKQIVQEIKKGSGREHKKKNVKK
jgi:hypothetical protein